MKELNPGDHVELRDAIGQTEGRVEWVSDDGQHVDVHWIARRGLDGADTSEVASDLRKLAAAA